ncbi:MAG: alpha/beta fold hydrolase [Myxococcaceae bacterium]|nr:alpha/beta fold hydrolase [Myxococcaceae bacterium]
MIRYLPVLALLSTGCFRLLAAPSPMKAERAVTQPPAKCLIVFLPGVADRANTFAAEGFMEAIKERHLSIDTVAADATVGYYLRGVEVPRLERDVVRPALANGYDQVWMVGVSMGGFGTLHYAATFPARLDGLLLLAPHLGEETVLQQIRDAGGLGQWEPPQSRRFHGANYTEDTWRWLKGRAIDGRPGPQVYLGFGESDLITGGNADLLASALPRENVLRENGGHSWSTWRRLWNRFLDESLIRTRCG